jgi:putative SOS response-associated peptidase YedK
MCGRFTLHTPEAEILDAFDIDALPVGIRLSPRFNIAPSQDVAVIRADNGQRRLGLARWGLVPGWSKEARPRYSTINARLESVAEKPAYRVPYRRKRCLVPADGFYEWQHGKNGKIPHHICMQDRGVFAFAGLWDHWEDGSEAFDSCVIITTAASGVMTQVHARMPVILDPANYAAWLDPALTEPRDITPCLAASPAGHLTAQPVSNYVNSPAHDDPGCLQPR